MGQETGSSNIFVQDPGIERSCLNNKYGDRPRKFERLLAALWPKFLNLPNIEIYDETEKNLWQIAGFVDADSVMLLEFHEHGIRHVLRWARKDIPLLPIEVVNNDLPWINQNFRNGTTMVVPCLSELPDEALRDRETLRKMGQIGFIGTPLKAGGEVICGIGYAFFQPQQLWSHELIEQLQLLGLILCGAIHRKQHEEQINQSISELRTLKSRLELENRYLQQEIKQDFNSQFIGNSAALQKVLSEIRQVAFSDSTVLILGETGTGKELVARAIHESSRRSGRPLVKVNCATLPPSLIESELFGHEKGAFTGALARKIGRFELADKSTLFLDEIGELQLDLQVKLLRVLQDGEFERIGSNEIRKVDVRVVAATNRNLETLVADGNFRSDLYYRLNVFPITCPPLRERPEDIPLLVGQFVENCNTRFGKKIDLIADGTMATLAAYRWPGNIRELQNMVERGVLLARNSRLEIDESLLKSGPSFSTAATQICTLFEQERKFIITVLHITNWRVSGEKGAAKILGLNPKTLESKMKKLNIRRPV